MELWDPKTSAFGGENESIKMCKCISLLSLPSFSPWMKTGLGGLCWGIEGPWGKRRLLTPNSVLDLKGKECKGPGCFYTVSAEQRG